MTNSTNINPISFFYKKALRAAFRKMPTWEVSKGRVLNAVKWSGQHISSPQNRLILGVTALMSQPFIDLYNKRVDDETRKVSAARTTAKIIAGTTTGFLIRYGVIKAVDKLCQNPKDSKNFIQSLMFPKRVRTTLKGLQQYKLALGTTIALAVMLFTNFAIDAPSTQLLTNVFVKKIKKYEKDKLDKRVLEQNENTVVEKLNNENLYIKRPTFDTFTRLNKKKEAQHE